MSAAGLLEAIPTDPPVAAAAWCVTRPCVSLGGLVLDEPLGALLVWLLAGVWIVAGVHFLRTRGDQRARLWWGIALVLGGVAAASAGTSYQAFGYELKCAGREVCVWTSWFEVVYLVLQNLSVAAMVLAVAHACTGGGLRRVFVAYAGANVLLHLLVTVWGVFAADAFLISFEMLLLFSTPGLLTAFVLNGVRRARGRAPLDAALLGAWVGLVLVNAVYYAYLLGGVGEALWRDGAGVYFTANDVLHVGMTAWVLYAWRIVGPRLRDLAPAPD